MSITFHNISVAISTLSLLISPLVHSHFCSKCHTLLSCLLACFLYVQNTETPDVLHIIYQTKDAACVVYVGAAVTGITNETI